MYIKGEEEDRVGKMYPGKTTANFAIENWPQYRGGLTIAGKYRTRK